jgi:hypothetical protein
LDLAGTLRTVHQAKLRAETAAGRIQDGRIGEVDGLGFEFQILVFGNRE